MPRRKKLMWDWDTIPDLTDEQIETALRNGHPVIQTENGPVIIGNVIYGGDRDEPHEPDGDDDVPY